MAPTRSSAPDATRTTRPRRMTSENPTSCASVHLAAASAYAVDSARRQAAMVNNTNESVRHTRVCACMDPPATSGGRRRDLLRGRLDRRLQVRRIPRDVAFEAILLEARTADRVRLASAIRIRLVMVAPAYASVSPPVSAATIFLLRGDRRAVAFFDALFFAPRPCSA